MNLYNLHSNPESLKYYDQAHEFVPDLAWEKYKDQPEELMKREHLWAKDSKYAYKYAKHIIKGRFLLGEPILAKNVHCAFDYARWILKGRFLLGEEIIATDIFYAYVYAREVIIDRFLLGEKIIATDPAFSEPYAFFIQTL